MATRETRRERGRQRGRALARRLIDEIANARKTAALSQSQLASAVGVSQSELSRLERLVSPESVTLCEMSVLASMLGLELSVGLHPVGDAIRDKGHQAVIGRFRALLSPAFRVSAEALLPGVGGRRAWDLLLRLATQLVGVECETRIRNIQALVRRIRERERDGGVDHIVLVLSDSQTNRRLLPDLLEALGPRFASPPRVTMKCLRSGQPLAGSGVVLV